MCVVSMVHEHYQKDWPGFGKVDPIKPVQDYYAELLKKQAVAPNQHPEWTLERWEEYQALLKKAAEYDKRMAQPDCPDPKKEAQYKEIEAYLVKKYGLKKVKAIK